MARSKEKQIEHVILGMFVLACVSVCHIVAYWTHQPWATSLELKIAFPIYVVVWSTITLYLISRPESWFEHKGLLWITLMHLVMMVVTVTAFLIQLVHQDFFADL